MHTLESRVVASQFVLGSLLAIQACTPDTTLQQDSDATGAETGSSETGSSETGSSETDDGPTCGDGIVEAGEACDDGNTDNTDHCLDSCEDASCGDGYVGPGEGCDDANDIDDDACTNACALASCGDGQLDGGEVCDDGNGDNSDECLDTCVAASCGDGYVWSDNESCDDGNGDNSDACIDSCEEATCGDGHTWAGNEGCDDGNADNTDACIDTCEEAACGDGHVWTDNEGCDDANDDNTDTCIEGCVAASCGDGYVGPGEGCDDANDIDDDLCTNACALASCGDGLVQDGEDCDDANIDNSDDCLDTCVAPVCGDGFVWAGNEDCDDANANNTDACPVTCVAAYCGDGFVWAGNEDCDDANDDESDACPSQCIDASCGDGFVWAGIEECDDGNLDAADGCSPACELEPNPPNNWTYRTNRWGEVTHIRFRSIVNFADDDIWMLGEVVVHFDGSWLTGYEVPYDNFLVMYDSASSPQGEMWVPENQHFYHYDGSGWAAIESLQSYGVLSVWRSPSEVVWLGAEDGMFLRSTDNGWEEVPGPVNEDITSLWGSQDADIWATTTGGKILHWDGGEWSIADQGNNGYVRVRGLANNEVLAVAPTGDVREWDGQSWEDVIGVPFGDYYDVYWLDSGRPCLAGGSQDDSRLSCVGNNDAWAAIQPTYYGEWLDTMTELSDERRIVADEAGGLVTLDPGSNWDTTALSDQYSPPLHGAWRRADDDIWAVSSDELVHYDGTNWVATQDTALPVWWRMSGFGDTGWIARDPGVMMRFDGGAWVEEDVPVADELIDRVEIHAEGEGWAIGIQSLLLRLHDGVWADASVPGVVPKDVFALADDDVYMVTDPPDLLHWDGQSWTPQPVPPADNDGSFLAIDGTDANNMWIVGDNDTVLQWDGVEWTEHNISLNPFFPEDFAIVDVDPGGEVWVRSYLSRFVRRYRDGDWTELELPFSPTVQATFRASDDSRWLIGNRIVEIHNWD